MLISELTIQIPPEVVHALRADVDAEYAAYRPRVYARALGVSARLSVELRTGTATFRMTKEFHATDYLDLLPSDRDGWWHAGREALMRSLRDTRVWWDRGLPEGAGGGA